MQLRLFHSFLAEYLIGTKCCGISLAPNDFSFIVLWDDLIWISASRKRHQIVDFTTARNVVIAAEFYGIWETLLLDFQFTANCDKICNGTQLLISNSVTKTASSILHIRPHRGLGFQWPCMQVTTALPRPANRQSYPIRCRWKASVSWNCNLHASDMENGLSRIFLLIVFWLICLVI